MTLNHIQGFADGSVDAMMLTDCCAPLTRCVDFALRYSVVIVMLTA